MIIKSFNVDFKQLLKKNFTLLYGENSSLVSEIEQNITEEAKSANGLIIKKYQEEYLLQNKDIFHQFINSDNLFGDQELLVVSKSTDRILEIFDITVAGTNKKKIVFLSQLLAKKSKLRILAETVTNFTCIACYNDTLEQLQSILLQKLKDNEILVSRELVNSIFEINVLNRQDINDAITKIELIQKTCKINSENLRDIFHSSSDSNNFEIINFCLLGDKKNINKILNNIYTQGINFNEILAALKYKVNKLIEITESNASNLNIDQLVEKHKPPIFWKEKNIVKEQLKRWTNCELKKLIEIIYDTEINCKKNYEISNTILHQFIVNASNKSCLENKFL